MKYLIIITCLLVSIAGFGQLTFPASATPSYMRATLAANTVLTTNNDVPFNTIMASVGSGISKSGNTYTLKGGGSYEIMCSVAFDSYTSGNGGRMGYNVVDVGSNTPLLGTNSGVQRPVSNNSAHGSQPVIHGIIAPVSDLTIKVRVTGSDGSATALSSHSFILIKKI